MKCINCDKETNSNGLDKCKKCYDKERYLKIKNGKWNFNSITPTTLSGIQEQILIGGLLGDSYLYKYKNQINVGLAIVRSAQDLKYLEFQFKHFEKFCSSPIKLRGYLDKRTNKKYFSCSFRTKAVEIFNSYKEKWYPKGEKIIPGDLKLTPLICAIWFCDDGSVVYTGLSNKNRRVSLYTDSFSKKEVTFLQCLLNETINVSFKISKKNSTKDLNKGFYLHLDKRDEVIKFINYIKDYVPKEMNRKSDRWKDYL